MPFGLVKDLGLCLIKPGLAKLKIAFYKLKQPKLYFKSLKDSKETYYLLYTIVKTLFFGLYLFRNLLATNSSRAIRSSQRTVSW